MDSCPLYSSNWTGMDRNLSLGTAGIPEVTVEQLSILLCVQVSPGSTIVSVTLLFSGNFLEVSRGDYFYLYARHSYSEVAVCQPAL
jgi:hypothetical protein